jgi:hypothetical protein
MRNRLVVVSIAAPLLAPALSAETAGPFVPMKPAAQVRKRPILRGLFRADESLFAGLTAGF